MKMECLDLSRYDPELADELRRLQAIIKDKTRIFNLNMARYSRTADKKKYCQICRFCREMNYDKFPHDCLQVPLSSNIYFQFCIVQKFVSFMVKDWIKSAVFPNNAFLYLFRFLCNCCHLEGHTHMRGTVCTALLRKYLQSDVFIAPDAFAEQSYFEPAMNYEDIFKQYCNFCGLRLMLPSGWMECNCSSVQLKFSYIRKVMYEVPTLWKIEFIAHVISAELHLLFLALYGFMWLVRPPERVIDLVYVDVSARKAYTDYWWINLIWNPLRSIA